MTPPVRRALSIGAQVLFALAVAWFGVKVMRDSWARSQGGLAAVDLARAWPAVPSLALAYLCFIAFSRRSIRAVGLATSVRQIFRVWAIPQAASYVPGKVWWVVSRFHELRRIGATPVQGVADIYIEEACMMVGCTFVGVLGLAAGSGAHRAALAGAAGAVVGVSALLLTPQVSSFAFQRIARAFRAEGTPPRLSLSVLAQIVARVVGLWVCFGIAFTAVCSALSPAVTAGDAVRIGGAYAIAWMAGVLSMLPGGLVAREGLLVLLLASVVGEKEIVVAAALMRGVTVALELAMAALAALLSRR